MNEIIVTHHKAVGKQVPPGARFGRWVILSVWRTGGRRGHTAALLRCSCGTVRILKVDALSRGCSRSCGCFGTEMNPYRHRVHGLSEQPLYYIWKQIRYRCEEPSCRGFKNYGGRGIKVCERWSCVENFIADMGPTYQKGLSIERKNNEGPYSPENCRWATQQEQMNNTRLSVRFSMMGQTHTLPEWARLMKINMRTLRNRIIRSGWPVERALTEPVRKFRS